MDTHRLAAQQQVLVRQEAHGHAERALLVHQVRERLVVLRDAPEARDAADKSGANDIHARLARDDDTHRAEQSRGQVVDREQRTPLHLAAAGQITSSKHEGGGQSPASPSSLSDSSLSSTSITFDLAFVLPLPPRPRPAPRPRLAP